ncbi:MAG: IS1096 element passenger TnpR family protein [Actinomycetota bacterium]
MARTWLSIRVEVLGGRGERFWPRPGRIFAASRSHTFYSLATAIDDAFARWDRSHLHEFRFDDGRKIGIPDTDWGFDQEVIDYKKTILGALKAGERFGYIFDFGDDWVHLCTVNKERIDPLETLGIVPERPLPYFGWGEIPDQYGRRWEDDDGESPVPPDLGPEELPEMPPRY